MTKHEIINETAAFYNSKNRSVEVCYDGEICCYFGPDGKRCAFSRCCLETEEAASILKESVAANCVLDDAKSKGIEILKEEYRGHSGEFWRTLQRFHDKPENWDENGLSEEGEVHKAKLLARWN